MASPFAQSVPLLAPVEMMGVAICLDQRNLRWSRIMSWALPSAAEAESPGEILHS